MHLVKLCGACLKTVKLGRLLSLARQLNADHCIEIDIDHKMGSFCSQGSNIQHFMLIATKLWLLAELIGSRFGWLSVELDF